MNDLDTGFVVRAALVTVGALTAYVALHLLRTDPLFGFTLALMAVGLFGVVASGD